MYSSCRPTVACIRRHVLIEGVWSMRYFQRCCCGVQSAWPGATILLEPTTYGHGVGVPMYRCNRIG
jgi:hypothetical protein